MWKGLWGTQTVAIKVLKRTADDELDPDGAEEFRKECETLQTIKHPNLIVFLGAGVTEDGKAFMVRLPRVRSPCVPALTLALPCPFSPGNR